MGSFRHEYWSGLPCPPLGDLPNSGIEPASPALAGGFFTPEPPGKPSEAVSPYLIQKLSQTSAHPAGPNHYTSAGTQRLPRPSLGSVRHTQHRPITHPTLEKNPCHLLETVQNHVPASHQSHSANPDTWFVVNDKVID